MREGLFTGPGAKRAQSVLYGLIFSGPVDYADLVKFRKCMILLQYSGRMVSFGQRSRLVQRRLASEFLRPLSSLGVASGAPNPASPGPAGQRKPCRGAAQRCGKARG